mmetsp:Transcript_49822/g.151640  ORF Transcript_49822/g.151640 Transcript_49822/m.151640 type:complete len:265 (+) Transcript_49822:1686-2480(+)
MEYGSSASQTPTRKTLTPRLKRPSAKLLTPLLENAVARIGPRLLRSQLQMISIAAVVFPVPGGPCTKLKLRSSSTTRRIARCCESFSVLGSGAASDGSRARTGRCLARAATETSEFGLGFGREDGSHLLAAPDVSATSANKASASGVQGETRPILFFVFFDGFSQLCSRSRTLSTRSYVDMFGPRSKRKAHPSGMRSYVVAKTMENSLTLSTSPEMVTLGSSMSGICSSSVIKIVRPIEISAKRGIPLDLVNTSFWPCISMLRP